MQPSPAVRYGVSVRARTPASSANLGPGFDSMALALELHDEVTVEAYEPAAGEPSVQIEVSGQGKGTVPLTEDHLVSAKKIWRSGRRSKTPERIVCARLIAVLTTVVVFPSAG